MVSRNENDLPFLGNKHVVLTYILILQPINLASHPENLAWSPSGLSSCDLNNTDIQTREQKELEEYPRPLSLLENSPGDTVKPNPSPWEHISGMKTILSPHNPHQPQQAQRWSSGLLSPCLERG